MEIGKKRARLIDDEKAADLKLYVTRRGTTTGMSTTSTGTVVGNVGVVVSGADEVNRLETLLRVGHYERSFVAEDDGWFDLAERVAKDVSVWLEANHQQVVSKR